METSEPDLAPPTRRETLVPALAVGAVAVVAVTAAFMVKRAETNAPVAANPEPVLAQPTTGVAVVQAPPLEAPSTRSMGAAAACASCGVVQMVVAVYAKEGGEPRAFQMHIRMDDGTQRTIEQRGALPAGSRVRVEGDAVRPLAGS